MSQSRRRRKQRRRFFVACEGQSESSYAIFIQNLAEEAELNIHLDVRRYNGGDPLVIVNQAVRDLHSQVGKKRRGSYAGHFIFLDADRRDDHFEKTRQVDRLLKAHDFLAIWSSPCFEALLLRHIPGCNNVHPQTAKQCIRELRKYWPNYYKGMTASELRTNIDQSLVELAARTLPELQRFLVAIGLIPRKRSQN